MPAAGKRSCASMYAEPTMPNVSFTPWATSVSQNASLALILILPVPSEALAIFFGSTIRFMESLLGRIRRVVAGQVGGAYAKRRGEAVDACGRIITCSR